MIYGYPSSGLNRGGNQHRTAPYAGAEDELQPESRFGQALAVRHAEDVSYLAIGAPNHDVGQVRGAGAVAVPPSRSYGPIRGREWSQDS